VQLLQTWCPAFLLAGGLFQQVVITNYLLLLLLGCHGGS
jgi:hypothetical protein